MKSLTVGLTGGLGALGLALALLVMVHPLSVAGARYSWQDASLLLALQTLLSILLLYVAEQRRRDSEIANKAFSAVVAAVVLWACMFVYWLDHTV